MEGLALSEEQMSGGWRGGVGVGEGEGEASVVVCKMNRISKKGIDHIQLLPWEGHFLPHAYVSVKKANLQNFSMSAFWLGDRFDNVFLEQYNVF